MKDVEIAIQGLSKRKRELLSILAVLLYGVDGIGAFDDDFSRF